MISEAKDILISLREGKKVQEYSVNFIQFLVQDLLDYAQINSKKFRSNIKKFDIRNCVQDVVKL